MNIDWMNVGKQFTENKEQEFINFFNKAEWQGLPAKNIAMMPAMAIQETIEIFQMRATHFTIINGYSHYSLYGIREKFKQGIVDLFILDGGNIVIPVAAVKHF